MPSIQWKWSEWIPLAGLLQSGCHTADRTATEIAPTRHGSSACQPGQSLTLLGNHPGKVDRKRKKMTCPWQLYSSACLTAIQRTERAGSVTLGEWRLGQLLNNNTYCLMIKCASILNEKYNMKDTILIVFTHYTRTTKITHYKWWMKMWLIVSCVSLQKDPCSAFRIISCVRLFCIYVCAVLCSVTGCIIFHQIMLKSELEELFYLLEGWADFNIT